MKTIITLFSLFLLLSGCNSNQEKTANDPKLKAIENVPTQEDEKWTNVGYDLKKGHPKGLKVGTKAPDFILKATDGSSFTLSESLQQQPIVMLFYRGQWCPVCSRYFSKFMEDLPEITAKGAKVIAVTPETNENIAKIVDETGISFPVFQDSDYSVMTAYDVLFHVTEKYQQKIRDRLKSDIATNNGQEDARLPVPATYVIGQDGIIKYVQFDLDYKNRASVKDILEHL